MLIRATVYTLFGMRMFRASGPTRRLCSRNLGSRTSPHTNIDITMSYVSVYETVIHVSVHAWAFALISPSRLRVSGPRIHPRAHSFLALLTRNARGGRTLALSPPSASSPPQMPNPRDSTRRCLHCLQHRDRPPSPSPSPPHRGRRCRLVLLHRGGTRNRGDLAAAPLFFSTAETEPHLIHRGGRTLGNPPAAASTVSNVESDPPSTSASPTH
jgi:hypothetical protein